MKKRQFIFLILTAVWMGVIFFFSSRTGDESSAESGWLVSVFERLFFPEWKELTPEAHILQSAGLSFFVRKLAHFTEYLILGVLSSGAFLDFALPGVLRILGPFGFCAFYAVTDELHQYFVSDRSAKVFDVLVDSAGGLFGTLTFLAVLALFLLSQKKKRNTELKNR